MTNRVPPIHSVSKLGKVYLRVMLDPVMNVWLRVFVWINGFDSSSNGQCTFFGSPEFISIGLAALDKLKTIDEPKYALLLNRRCRFIYQKPRSDFAGDMFFINQDFTAWGCDGICVWLAFAYFKFTEYDDQKDSLSNGDQRKAFFERTVKIKTREWLAEHAFPEELMG